MDIRAMAAELQKFKIIPLLVALEQYAALPRC
jgi:hypothetical protein